MVLIMLWSLILLLSLGNYTKFNIKGGDKMDVTRLVDALINMENECSEIGLEIEGCDSDMLNIHEIEQRLSKKWIDIYDSILEMEVE